MNRSKRLIERQLRKSGLERTPEVDEFLELVLASYNEFERDRQLTEHSTKLASDELAKNVESLDASERLFRSLARCTPNGIIYTDIEGRCLYANESAERLTGRSAEELAGGAWLSVLHPEDRQMFFATAKGSSVEADRNIEHRVIADDGSEIWVSTVIGSLLDGSGNGVGWVASFEDITDRKMHERELSLLARHDSLTQLLNRHALRQRLDELFDDPPCDGKVAIALIDLDRFKLVNDTFGHEVGDKLLIAVADILRNVVSKNDLVARLGGDEFAVVAVLDADASPSAFGAMLSEALNGPADLGTRVVHIGSSVGVAVVDKKGTTPTSLLRDADRAMYRAKRSVVHDYEVFDESYREEVTRRFILEGELRAAVDNQTIALRYQPIFDSVSGRIPIIEALVQWESTTLGPILPSEFIPIVEDLGLASVMGEELLSRACAQLKKLRLDSPRLEHLTMSFNVSPQQLSDPLFPELVGRVLAINELPGSALILEITEGAILSDVDRTTSVLEMLRGQGVVIAIDNFGTGYSSLSYLGRLPVSYLKIDESFVRSIGSGSEYESSNRLADTIVNLALRFDLAPIAVGVQTEEQRAVLRHSGCELMQGDLVAKPLSGNDPELAEALLAHGLATAPVE